MILTKSPHYINIAISYATTYSVQIDLYIWEGTKGNEPLEPTYILTKERPDITATELDVEISHLIEDYITNKPTLETTSGKKATLTGNGVWVKYVVSFNDDVETIAPIETIDFAVSGYGYHLEGINPDIPISRVLTSTNIQKVDDAIYFPYIADGTINQLDVSDGTTTQTYSLADEQDSVNRLGFLYIDVLDFNGQYITITDSVNEWVYEVVTECKYTPEKILFLNKYGAYELFTFFKARKDSLKVSSKDFNNAFISNGNYDIQRHQMQRYGVTATESFELNTDYIAEEENERINQLLLSESVYLIKDNALVPVKVATDTLDIKTRINDKLVNYSLSFSYAFNKINHV
jgi:hypothetical protein